MAPKIKKFLLITVSTLIIVGGHLFHFKFPNNFSFGGVTGIAVVLARVMPFSAASINFVISMALLAVGFCFLGRGFGLMTAYSSVAPVGRAVAAPAVLPHVRPAHRPAAARALLRDRAARLRVGHPLQHRARRAAGTDIVAMILKKHTSTDIGAALFFTDLIVALSACFVFDIKSPASSPFARPRSTLVIDNVIESINLANTSTSSATTPSPSAISSCMCSSAALTVCEAQGAFTHGKKAIVFTALKRPQAMALRQFVRATEPNAFILISNTSEIIGKGFLNS